MMRSSWSQEVWRMLLLVAVCGAIGALSGYPIHFLALGLAVGLGWHLYQLRRLLRWLDRKNPSDPGSDVGIWRDIYLRIIQLRQRNRERKRKLTELLLQFQASAAAMPDAAVSLGPGWTIEWFNDAAERLLGLDSRRDSNKGLTNLFRSPQLSNYLNRGEFEGALELTAPGNPKLKLSIRVFPYAENRWLMLAQDVTERIRLERVRKDFIANVSHELRTPLTVVAGFVENMQQDEIGIRGRWVRPIKLMEQQTARMKTVVEDLLLLARLEAGQAVRDDQVLDISKLTAELAEVATNTRSECPGIELDMQADVGLLGDEMQIRSAFQNLVINAVNHTPDDGRITLIWRLDDEQAVFVVKDTGEGVAAEHLPRLTERFYRVDKARSRQTGGTGLGLAIVKHVLQLHDAELEIASTPGIGSEFSCRFPSSRLYRQVPDNVVSLKIEGA